MAFNPRSRRRNFAHFIIDNERYPLRFPLIWGFLTSLSFVYVLLPQYRLVPCTSLRRCGRGISRSERILLDEVRGGNSLKILTAKGNYLKNIIRILTT